jgi:hypothetical protein
MNNQPVSKEESKHKHEQKGIVPNFLSNGICSSLIIPIKIATKSANDHPMLLLKIHKTELDEVISS